MEFLLHSFPFCILNHGQTVISVRAHLGRDRSSDDFGHVGTISSLPVRGVLYDWSANILDAPNSRNTRLPDDSALTSVSVDCS